MNPTQQTILTLTVVATLLPLASALIVLFFGKLLKGAAAWVATGLNLVGFLCAAANLLSWLSLDEASPLVWNIPWIPVPSLEAGWLHLGVMVDSLTIGIMAMVTFIATLVHLYSIGYMQGDKRYNRFFCYLSLFVFSMLGIVVANSIMQLFVFWELVGLTSYLLIGFWFEKKGPQLACKKAFVMNRVGDAGFLVGFGILFAQLGGRVLLPPVEGVIVDGQQVMSLWGVLNQVLAEQGHTITDPPMWLTVAGIGLFCGAIGKSAQFPLHTWLPDAMEGPTPVSSIVHSATMVAAGVYLTARIYPILTPGAHLFISTIGLITLVMAACMAVVMTDIKKVLAYSTLSQLGYMILALGAGGYAFALFHLITHAFFKCCLFQCSGSVINAAHHEQDMRQYGGLWKKMPVTGTCYLLCTFAIAGVSIPFTSIAFSGFYSKDGIIAATVGYGESLHGLLGWWANLYWLGPMVIAYVTAFYMARSFALTFLGKPRNEHLHEHAHEVSWHMLVPQALLATLAVIAAVLPFLDLIVATEPVVPWVQVAADLEHGHGMHLVHVALLYGFGPLIALAAGVLLYTPGFGVAGKIAGIPGINLIHKWWLNKFGFDGLYDLFTVNVSKILAGLLAMIDKYLVDGLVNLVGAVMRTLGEGVGLFDRKVVDGTVNGAATFAQSGGAMLREAQAGKVRTYVLLMFTGLALAALLVITVVLATT